MQNIRKATSLVLMLLAVWLLLTAGNITAWIVGLPFIALAIYLRPSSISISENSSRSVNLIGLTQFIHFFIRESFLGAIDVSRRVLSGKPEISPAFYHYNMQLKLPHAQQFFISSISLLPGTLCADMDVNQLRIHTLDQQTDTSRGIKRLESLVAKIFGEDF